MQQRTIYLDNVCALLIIHMIFVCHQPLFCNYSSPSIDFCLKLLSFFMAWFFFKAGMVFKDRPTKDVARSSFRRLLVPYFAFSLIGIAIMGLQQYVLGHNPFSLWFLKYEFNWLLENSTFFPTQACWFLLSLFIVRVVYSSIHKKKLAPPIAIVAISIALGWLIYEFFVKDNSCYTLAVLNSHYKIHVPFYIGNMFHGLAFYTLGYWLKDKQFNRYLLVIALSLFVLKFLFFAFMDFRGTNTDGGNYLLCIAYELSGCIVVNNVFRKWVNREIPLLSHIGRNSMVYYLVHYPLMTFIVMFLNPFPGYTNSVRYILLSVILILLLVVSDYIFRIKRLKPFIGG